jgi:hypothetical protein
MTAAQVLAEATEPLRAREIARLAGLPTELVYEQLVALEARGEARMVVSYPSRGMASVVMWEKM